MTTVGMCSHETLDPPLLISGNQELLSQNILGCPAPHVVKIPCKMMLDLILEELTLPKPRYDFHTDDRGRVTAVVTFYSSTRMPGNLLRPIKLGGAEAVDYKVAEESTAREGITFVEAWENMEIEDLHYSELRYLEANREDLLAKLDVLQKEKKNLQSSLSLAASQMIAFSNQIYNITCNNHSLSQGNAAENINATICLFEGLAADLGQTGKRLKKDLKKDRAFP